MLLSKLIHVTIYLDNVIYFLYVVLFFLQSQMKCKTIESVQIETDHFNVAICSNTVVIQNDNQS